MKFSKYSFAGCLVCLVAVLALAQAATNPSTANDTGKPSSSSADANSIVGTVVMWWGNRNEIPNGWELCDGQKAKTPGAALKGNKPNLVDRFPKGALASRSSTEDLTKGIGGDHNMPALQITKIEGLKIAEDGEHSHASLELASAPHDEIDQANNKDAEEVTIVKSKRNAKAAKADTDKEALVTEGRHSHKLNGFVGTDGGVNADGADKTGANQPAYAELFFIIRVK